MSTKAAAYVLDDEDGEGIEMFYKEDGTVPREDPDFIAAPKNEIVQSAPIEQFEVEDSKADGSGSSTAWKYLTVSRYNQYFRVTLNDITSRITRTFVPTTSLFAPPTVSSEGQAVPSAEATSVESSMPFNSEPDLYGPIWLTTTLVLCIAVGANILTLFESIAHKSDVMQHSVSALTAVNFRHLVQAASIVYIYTIVAAVATAAGKKYYNDNTSDSAILAVCIYGYASAPFIPAVLLCAIPNTALNWIFMGMAVAISTWFIFTNLWPTYHVEDESSAGVYGSSATPQERSPRWWMQVTCVVTHILFAVLLKMRFF